MNRVRSANTKIVQTNKRLGVDGIGKMQGTTRIIYDSIKLANTTTSTVLTLFKDANNRRYPFTNLSENKLQVGESMAMQRFSFQLVTTVVGTDEVQGIFPLYYFPQFARMYRSDMSFSIAQSQVIKALPLQSMYAPFNRNSNFYGMYQLQPAAGDLASFGLPHDVFHFDNDIIIPPQIEFQLDLQIPLITLPAGSDWYLMCTLEGLGSLYSPKANF